MLDYKFIVDYIMYQCKNTTEVEEYLKQITTSISLSVPSGESYLLFVTNANIYVKIREQLEIHPRGAIIYQCENGQEYEGSVVYANLEYALKRVATSIETYIQKPIKNEIN